MAKKAALTVPCIRCEGPLPNIAGKGQNQPAGGIEFTSRGHYGTRVFDPLDGSFIAVNVCDVCLEDAGKRGLVLYGEPAPMPERGTLVKWTP